MRGVVMGVSGGEEEPEDGALVFSMSSSMSSGSKEPWVYAAAACWPSWK